WEREFDRVLAMQRDGGSLLGRLDLMLKRLMLLFAVNDKSDEIQDTHVAQAMALADYIRDCFEVLAKKMSASRSSDLEDRIRAGVRKFMASDDPAASLGPTADQIKRPGSNGRAAVADFAPGLARPVRRGWLARPCRVC